MSECEPGGVTPCADSHLRASTPPPLSLIHIYLNLPPRLKANAQNLCFAYNATGPDEGARRAELLGSLLGTCHPLTFIEPAFRCDYGFNIHTHGLAVINYNCVILDTSPVHIGANAFLAPGVCLACAGHSVDAAQRAQGVSTSKPITLEDDV